MAIKTGIAKTIAGVIALAATTIGVGAAHTRTHTTRCNPTRRSAVWPDVGAARPGRDRLVSGRNGLLGVQNLPLHLDRLATRRNNQVDSTRTQSPPGGPPTTWSS